MSLDAEKRLRRDFKNIYTNPPPGIIAVPRDNDIFVWKAVVCGPENSPFEGGAFRLCLEFRKDYPNTAPRVSFCSKMFHPNVYVNGRVGLDILEEPKKWRDTYDVADVLSGIQAMLGHPVTGSPANAEANALFTNKPDLYEQIVRRDIVERASQIIRNGDEDPDEETNENIVQALEQQVLEMTLNERAISELVDSDLKFLHRRQNGMLPML